MDKMYFERLHQEEARRAEWRSLDYALAARTNKQPVRVRVGYLLIKAGATLAHESVTVQSKPCRTNYTG
jgi:hypothetical protein